jgi:hypothetical protein
MPEQYRHTQMGYLTLTLAGAVLILCVALMLAVGFNWIGFIVALSIGICMILFYSLTVEVGKDFLKINFGPGVIRKSFLLKDMEACQQVKNPWYYGWGIRWTPQGWLFNVSGLSAVEIRMKNGKKYRIGTDVPHELESIIRQAIETSKS